MARPLPEAFFGEGTGLIVLNNPLCSGDEASLVECQSSFFFFDSTHAFDVGVGCFDTIGKQQMAIVHVLVDGGSLLVKGRLSKY